MLTYNNMYSHILTYPYIHTYIHIHQHELLSSILHPFSEAWAGKDASKFFNEIHKVPTRMLRFVDGTKLHSGNLT